MAFPSTYADIKAEVIARLRLDATADASRTGDWINQVYAEVCVETEALQDYCTMALTANSAVYTLDVDILRFKEMYVTPSGQGQSRPLIPVSIEAILQMSASNGATAAQSGSVTHYAVLGLTKIQFYPTPYAADTITAYYVKLPTALSGSTDVPELPEPYASNCLTEGACFQAAMFLKDPDALLYKQNYDQSVRALRGHLRRKVGAMTQAFRLVGSDNYPPHDPSTDIRRRAS